MNEWFKTTIPTSYIKFSSITKIDIDDKNKSISIHTTKGCKITFSVNDGFNFKITEQVYNAMKNYIETNFLYEEIPTIE